MPALRKLGLQDPRSPQGQRMQNLVIQAVAEARELLGIAQPKQAAAPPVMEEAR